MIEPVYLGMALGSCLTLVPVGLYVQFGILNPMRDVIDHLITQRNAYRADVEAMTSTAEMHRKAADRLRKELDNSEPKQPRGPNGRYLPMHNPVELAKAMRASLPQFGAAL